MTPNATGSERETSSRATEARSTGEGEPGTRALPGGAFRSRPPAPALIAASLLVGLAALVRPAAAQDADGRGADGADYPFVPTPAEVVAEMLEMADVTAEDSVYDLGSGDGRIVVTAARRYGAAGLGVELDSSLVAEARRRAASEQVQDRVRMVRGNLFDVDLSPATVVTLYLLPRTMAKLEPRLFRQLRPGARIVAHDFDMDRWAADSVTRMPGGLGGHATLYYWVVPVRVGGTWAVSAPSGDSIRLRIDQRYQELRARAASPAGARVEEARVVGDSIHLRLSVRDGDPLTLAGTVSGDRMSGRSGGGDGWSARRVADSDVSLTAWHGEEAGRRQGGPDR